MDIKELAEKYEDYLIERRRYYHAHPETSHNEKETRAQIRKDLEAMGITDIREMEHCYGLTARIHGGKPGKTVALRTDIDALEIKEETGLPFASTNGAMHACGHDNHITGLLGAAKILNEIKDQLSGDVLLVVQPSEELATGALNMMKENALEGVDAIYGTHVWGNFEGGKFSFESGKRMACCHGFKIKVEGVAAHGSAPNLGKDALTCSAAIINNLQQIVSRQNDPLNPLVITVGKIDGGSRFNVICNHVDMEGTVRTFLPGTEVEDAMRKVIELTAETFGMTASLSYDYMTVPVLNTDEQLNRLAQNAVKKLYGEESLAVLDPMMGAEDFSWYGDACPYVYGFIGTRDEEKGFIYTNHHEKYTIDEGLLVKSAAVMAQFAYDYLEETK